MTDCPHLISEIWEPPEITIGVPLPTALFANPRYRERELYAPTYEWRSGGIRYRYKVPVIVKNYTYDLDAMRADLMRAWRSTGETA